MLRDEGKKPGQPDGWIKKRKKRERAGLKPTFARSISLFSFFLMPGLRADHGEERKRKEKAFVLVLKHIFEHAFSCFSFSLRLSALIFLKKMKEKKHLDGHKKEKRIKTVRFFSHFL